MADELVSLLDFVLDLLRRLRPRRLLPRAVDEARRARRSARDEEWDEATEALRQAAADQGPRARARRGRRRVLRPEDLGAGPRRHRPHVADVHDPARLPDARSASSIEYVGADNERHQPIMIHRALFGSIERFFARARRALRRRLPRVAGAGAGPGAARCAATTTPTPSASSTGSRATASASTSSRPTSRSAAASARPSSRSCPYVLVVGDDDVERRHGRRQRRAAPTSPSGASPSTPSSSGSRPRSWPRPDARCRSTTSGPPGARRTSARSSTPARCPSPRRPAAARCSSGSSPAADEEGDEAAGIVHRGPDLLRHPQPLPVHRRPPDGAAQPGGGRPRGPHARRSTPSCGRPCATPSWR